MFRKLRPLTGGEIELAREIFGSALDYSRVQLQRGGFLSLYAGAVTIRNSIYVNVTCYEPDYAAPSVRLGLRALLMHELVHVWQYQNLREYHWTRAGLEHVTHFRRVYEYELPARFLSENPIEPDEAGAAFLHYRYEQQGRLVQDYYMLKKLGRDVTAYERVIGETLRKPGAL